MDPTDNGRSLRCQSLRWVRQSSTPTELPRRAPIYLFSA